MQMPCFGVCSIHAAASRLPSPVATAAVVDAGLVLCGADAGREEAAVSLPLEEASAEMPSPLEAAEELGSTCRAVEFSLDISVDSPGLYGRHI